MGLELWPPSQGAPSLCVPGPGNSTVEQGMGLELLREPPDGVAAVEFCCASSSGAKTTFPEHLRMSQWSKGCSWKVVATRPGLGKGPASPTWGPGDRVAPVVLQGWHQARLCQKEPLGDAGHPFSPGCGWAAPSAHPGAPGGFSSQSCPQLCLQDKGPAVSTILGWGLLLVRCEGSREWLHTKLGCPACLARLRGSTESCPVSPELFFGGLLGSSRTVGDGAAPG